MSTNTAAVSRRKEAIYVYGHSMLFYFWPLWVFGYAIGFYTWLTDGYLLTVSRQDLEKHGTITVKLISEQGEGARSIIKAEIGDPRNQKNPGKEVTVTERVAPSKNPGVLYALLILLVIFITNVPLRGLLWMIVLLTVILLGLLFAYLDWWDAIFSWFGRLSIHMNMGFYMFFSTVLLILWLICFFGYDRLNYWEIVPGQVRHIWPITGAVKSYDTTGMHFEKVRDDAFRHWILGLGSGDLVMTPAAKSPDVSRDDLTVRNVLFVGRKLNRILHLIAERPQ
ncbi:MAG: hypothetical protein NZM42_00590 [Gemmatales bacterium]|nr:hypothetical protein [Gemmatales bacterium]MDW8221501.1 hypothetical protein [Gemmatales bacterium]